MRVLLEKIFKRKVKETKHIFDSIQKISSLSHQLESLKEELEEEEASFILKYQDEFFLSLKDFFSIVNSIEKLSIAELLLLFKHVSEIKTDNFASVTLYAIPEKNHIILCEDPSKCEQHKNFKGKPINISTFKIK